ncbi:Anaphase-promoting complex subunit 23 [Rhizophlyctis rosea]|nr:Anaphase-promoting complex subunit 23 [Rhizophlyctis rosea]
MAATAEEAEFRKVTEVNALRTTLRDARACLDDRCLLLASKWVSQLITGLVNVMIVTDRDGRSLLDAELYRSTLDDVLAVFIPGTVRETEEDSTEMDVYYEARSYFLNREHARAAETLRFAKGRKANFLRLYALYLKGEKEKEEVIMGQESPLEQRRFVNKQLIPIEEELSQLVPIQVHQKESVEDQDPFYLYLRGVVNADLGRTKIAQGLLFRSVHLYPWNWSAWEALAGLVDSVDLLNDLRARAADTIMRDFCVLHIANELAVSTTDNTWDYEWSRLESLFPESAPLLLMRGLSFYAVREFPRALPYFEKLHKKNPYRVDHMDIYSNVLYLREKFVELSELAHRMFDLDRFRYETCLIVANYYSTRREHEYAVMFFQRALKLNPQYIEAWILIGHEYIELRNIHAAIAAYRKASILKPTDYRAWYGLGMAYRIANISELAVTHFQRALAIQDKDFRVWNNLGQVYQELGHVQEAIAAYKRGLINDRSDQLTLLEIERLYRKLYMEDTSKTQYQEQAVLHFGRYMRYQDPNVPTTDARVEIAALFAAGYHRANHNYEEAMRCLAIVEFSEQAKHLSREIQMEGATTLTQLDNIIRPNRSSNDINQTLWGPNS